MPVTTIPTRTGVPTTEPYSSFAAFPGAGRQGVIYIDLASSDFYLWTGTVYELQSGGGGGGGVWGSITGTLSSQTDLQSALNAKENSITSGTTSQYWRGDKTFQTLDKAAVGLGNVDNTSDLNKSISTATQAALDLKDTILDPAVNPDLYTIFQTDFAQNDRATLNVAASGAGAAATNDATTGCNTTENCFGVYEMSTGTTTTGRCSIYNSGTWALGSHAIDYGIRFALSALSDATDTYTVYAGIADNPGAGNVTDGVYFQYTHGTNSGRWQAIVADAGTRVAFDTGVAPTATVNQVFRIVINQAGTQALFYIDGTLTNTVSSGLPGAGDFTLFNNKIEKSAGTTSRAMSVDWLYIKTTRSSAR